jgi:disulfide bond formation protein DsbB
MVGTAPCLLCLTQRSEFANAYQGAAPLPYPEAPVQTKKASGAAILLTALHVHRF